MLSRWRVEKPYGSFCYILLTHYNVFTEQKHIERSYFNFTPVVASHLCLDSGQVLVDMIFTQSQQIHLATVLVLVGGASQLTHSTIRSMCKSICAPPFTLLIVPYNFMYHNYIIIMQWLVGLGMAKRGFASAKMCTLTPWYSYKKFWHVWTNSSFVLAGPESICSSYRHFHWTNQHMLGHMTFVQEIV